MRYGTVLADGVFDPIHVGHVRYLAFANEQAGELVVRIADDATIRAKGRLPFQSQAERAELLQAFLIVDHTVLANGDDLAATIRGIRPTVFVKGIEWQNRLPADVQQACTDVGAQVVFWQGSLTDRHTAERMSDSVDLSYWQS